MPEGSTTSMTGCGTLHLAWLLPDLGVAVAMWVAHGKGRARPKWGLEWAAREIAGCRREEIALRWVMMAGYGLLGLWYAIRGRYVRCSGKSCRRWCAAVSEGLDWRRSSDCTHLLHYSLLHIHIYHVINLLNFLS